MRSERPRSKAEIDGKGQCENVKMKGGVESLRVQRKVEGER